MKSHNGARRRGEAAVFSALGDPTRLRLISRLARGEPRSIAELTAGTKLTRQAVTKHLKVLEKVGLVRGLREGRESRFAFDPRATEEARNYLDQVSGQWEQALAQLKAFVES